MSPEEMSAVYDRIQRAKACRDELNRRIRSGDVSESTLDSLEMTLLRERWLGTAE